jgi:hypothetical protein
LWQSIIYILVADTNSEKTESRGITGVFNRDYSRIIGSVKVVSKKAKKNLSRNQSSFVEAMRLFCAGERISEGSYSLTKRRSSMPAT